MKKYVIEETPIGSWRTTCPDDAGIHVVMSDPLRSLEVAMVSKMDLDRLRSADKAESISADAYAGDCGTCGEPYERVRPGKTQPTCDCDDYCPMGCGNKRRHFAVGETARQKGGLLCPVCDAGETPDES